jgi:hypothetical protein
MVCNGYRHLFLAYISSDQTLTSGWGAGTELRRGEPSRGDGVCPSQVDSKKRRRLYVVRKTSSMYPRDFEYFVRDSIEEAIRIVSFCVQEAKLFAGARA